MNLNTTEIHGAANGRYTISETGIVWNQLGQRMVPEECKHGLTIKLAATRGRYKRYLLDELIRHSFSKDIGPLLTYSEMVKEGKL